MGSRLAGGACSIKLGVISDDGLGFLMVEPKVRRVEGKGS